MEEDSNGRCLNYMEHKATGKRTYLDNNFQSTIRVPKYRPKKENFVATVSTHNRFAALEEHESDFRWQDCRL